MGYSLSWIAVRNPHRELLLARFGLVPTGEFEVVPESPFTGVELPSGWYVVVANHSEDVSPGSSVLAAVSTNAELVACRVEEHVMVSEAWGWSGGRQAWQVVHDCQLGRRHLDEFGALPAEYAAIRQRLLAEQDRDPDGADYVFDIPVALAEALTGYRHDGAAGEGRFEVLKAKRRRWWPWGRD